MYRTPANPETRMIESTLHFLPRTSICQRTQERCSGMDENNRLFGNRLGRNLAVRVEPNHIRSNDAIRAWLGLDRMRGYTIVSRVSALAFWMKPILLLLVLGVGYQPLTSHAAEQELWKARNHAFQLDKIVLDASPLKTNPSAWTDESRPGKPFTYEEQFYDRPRREWWWATGKYTIIILGCVLGVLVIATIVLIVRMQRQPKPNMADQRVQVVTNFLRLWRSSSSISKRGGVMPALFAPPLL